LANSPTTKICSTFALSTGTFSCSGVIPSSWATAGAKGVHNITAFGEITYAFAKTKFTLT
jgi:hypothetical protein